MAKKNEAQPRYNATDIRDISVEVYKIRLGADDTRRMLEKDAKQDPADNGKKLRGRAGSYDPLTIAYLDTLHAYAEKNNGGLPYKSILYARA